MESIKPNGWTPHDRRPAMIFWHGGGWRRGPMPQQMRWWSERISHTGIVTFCPPYIADGNVLDCCKEALAQFDEVFNDCRAHGVDPYRIIVAGASAGGHLALNTLAMRSEAAAAVCFCPIVDLRTFKGWDVSDQSKPYINPMEDQIYAPALLLTGREDTLIDPEEVDAYCQEHPQATHLSLPGAHDFFSANRSALSFVKGWLDCLRLTPRTTRDTQHRTLVGGEWESWGGMVFNLLADAGLRRSHKVVDFGCGPGRVGKHLISYLMEGNYTGIDKNAWYLKRARDETVKDWSSIWTNTPEPTQFQNADFILCHNVFHWYPRDPEDDINLFLDAAYASSPRTTRMFFSAFLSHNRWCDEGKNHWYFTSDFFNRQGWKVVAIHPLTDMQNNAMLELIKS